MKARRSLLWTIGVLSLLTITLLLPEFAAAQTPVPRLPGETPEVVKPYATWWLAYLVVAGAAGLALLLGFAYWRLSSRFYGREEPPPPQRPRFAAMSVAQPVAAAPQGTASAQPGAAAAARAEAAPGQVAAPAERAAEAPKAPAAEAATAEKPAAEKPAAEKPAATENRAAAPVSSAAGGHVEPDQETFDRVLQEQIDKGVDRRVAEGRARAAAIKAAREKAGTG